MASNIDTTQPPQGEATTSAVRANFAAAKAEIESLQTDTLILSNRLALPSVKTAGRYPLLGNVPAFSPSTLLPITRLLYLLPYIAPRNMSLSKLAVAIAQPVDSFFRLGVYASSRVNGSDIPAALLASTGTLSSNTYGVVQSNISLSLVAGQLYWVACVFNARPTVYAYPASILPPVLGWDPTSLIGYTIRSASLPNYTLPDPAPTTAQNLIAPPLVWGFED